MATKLTFFGILASVLVQAQYWDYYYQGNDWPGTCQTGYMQSPISLSDETSVSIPFKSDVSVEIYMSFVKLQIQGYFNSYSYVLNGNWGSGISVNTTFGAGVAVAKRVEFHAPAEHKINGKSFDLEMQITLYDATATAYKLSVLYLVNEKKRDSSFFNGVYQSLNAPAEIDILKAFGDKQLIRNFYFYIGSYNIPPCTEGVKWLVWAEPQYISVKDLEFFTGHWANEFSFAHGNGNNREINPTNGRLVIHYEGEDEEKESNAEYLQSTLLLIISIIGLY